MLPSRAPGRGLHQLAAACLVQDEAFKAIALAAPGRLLKRDHGVAVTGFPALANALRAEIIVLGMVFIFERWSKQPDDVHRRGAAVAAHFGDRVVFCPLR